MRWKNYHDSLLSSPVVHTAYRFRLILPTLILRTLILPTEDQFVSFHLLNYNYIIIG